MEETIRGGALLAEGRDTILAALRDGPPMTLPELPRRWPVTRPMVAAIVEELLRRGLLGKVPGGRIPGQTAYALTSAGRREAAHFAGSPARGGRRGGGRATA